MSIKYNTNQSKLFKDFRAIHPGNYRSLIGFYERNELGIEDLPVEEQFVMLCYYTNALFGMGGGHKHILIAERVLEYSIIHNTQYVDGVDIYAFTLYQKAVSHLKLQEIDKATSIASQLLRIDHKEKHHAQLLRKCLMSKRPSWVRSFFAAGLVSFFIAASSATLRILVVEPFYPVYLDAAWWLQLGTLILGMGAIVSGVIGHHRYVNREIKSVVQLAQSKEVVQAEEEHYSHVG